jgi:hypothetical protein
MIAFENIKPGSRLRGLDTSGLAEVVQVVQFGPDALNVVFRVDWRVDQRLVMRCEEGGFGISRGRPNLRFDGYYASPRTRTASASPISSTHTSSRFDRDPSFNVQSRP